MRRTKARYYNPHNNFYFRRSNSKPKRWHKAVASRSIYGSSNPNAFSRFVPYEKDLHHTERKETKLPCGRTIAESWAALRKSWLGFKIALSNDDTALMTHYASFITKVQTEMGIQVTDFDSDILDEQTISDAAKSCFYKKPVEKEDRTEEKALDYDSMMDDARSKVISKSEKVAPPRQNIFDSSENSCWYHER